MFIDPPFNSKRNYNQIYNYLVSIAEMLEGGVRLDIAISLEVLKSARTVTEKVAHPQLFGEDE